MFDRLQSHGRTWYVAKNQFLRLERCYQDTTTWSYSSLGKRNLIYPTRPLPKLLFHHAGNGTPVAQGKMATRLDRAIAYSVPFEAHQTFFLILFVVYLVTLERVFLHCGVTVRIETPDLAWMQSFLWNWKVWIETEWLVLVRCQVNRDSELHAL